MAFSPLNSTDEYFVRPGFRNTGFRPNDFLDNETIINDNQFAFCLYFESEQIRRSPISSVILYSTLYYIRIQPIFHAVAILSDNNTLHTLLRRMNALFRIHRQSVIVWATVFLIYTTSHNLQLHKRFEQTDSFKTFGTNESVLFVKDWRIKLIYIFKIQIFVWCSERRTPQCPLVTPMSCKDFHFITKHLYTEIFSVWVIQYDFHYSPDLTGLSDKLI